MDMSATNQGYESVIGLEVHAQLATASKAFCACRVAHDAPPNSLTCPVCLGLPGAMPVLNAGAVERAVLAIFSLGGTIQSRSAFARKNYFYPDLPKGYQISQYDSPLGRGGQVTYICKDGTQESWPLERIHIEEDAGKSLHGESHTRLDFNRCGIPLVEIVSKPQERTPAQARACVAAVRQTLKCIGVCTGDMEKGHLRCDANVSVIAPGKTEPGNRTEIKNLNSLKAIERALTFEIARQTEAAISGRDVEQATLFWDESSERAQLMRTKEESEDYRYFPEPDLPELILSEEWLDALTATLPELPLDRVERLTREYGIRSYDSELLCREPALADYFEAVAGSCHNPRLAVNWIATEVLACLSRSNMDIASLRVTPAMMADLLRAIESGELTGSMAKTVFARMASTGLALSAVMDDFGLAPIGDEAALRPVVADVIAENPDNVRKYRAGKVALMEFFVGQVMKRARGQADPKAVRKLLLEELSK